MARKDFDEYFKKVSTQYQQLQVALEDMSEEVNKGLFAPERLEQLKLTIQPIKNSFETLSYIKYLLDKPARRAKVSRYNGQNKKLISSFGDKRQEEVITNNDKILKQISTR